MAGTTTRYALPYPTGEEVMGGFDTSMKALAEAVDPKISIPTVSGSGAKYVEDICVFEAHGTITAPYILVNTNIPFGNHMVTVRVRGSIGTVNGYLDVTLSFYAYQPDGLIYNKEMTSRGTMAIETSIWKRPDGNITISIYSNTSTNQWPSPKIKVDAMVGHTSLSDDSLRGWWVNRAFDNQGMEYKGALSDGNWANVSGFQNSWTNFDAPRPVSYMKSADGWVRFRGLMRSGTLGAVAFQMPGGFRPQIRQTDEHHFVVSAGSAFGLLTIDGAGQVKFHVGNNGWVDLAQLTYKAHDN